MKIDVSQAIVAKSDQQNADDFIGRNRTVRVTKVSVQSGEQPVWINFEGDDGKPWKPCKSMLRVIVAAWGLEGADWVGRSLTLYREEEVKFGGQKVGGIRVSHMSHIDGPMTIPLNVTRGKKQPYTVQPLETNNKHSTTKAAINWPERLRAAASVEELGNVWKSLSKQEQAEHLTVKDDRKRELASQTATPSTGETLPDLDTLLVQLEAAGHLPGFLGEHNVLCDDLEASKGAKRLEWSLKVSDYLKQHSN